MYRVVETVGAIPGVWNPEGCPNPQSKETIMARAVLGHADTEKPDSVKLARQTIKSDQLRLVKSECIATDDSRIKEAK